MRRDAKRTDWLRLDNAAKIYPATRTEKWSAVFRVTVVLKEDIDPVVLQQSVAAAITRFPSFYVQMRRGFFWYYLDLPPGGLVVRPAAEYEPPCQTLRDEEGVIFRVLYHGCRLAVEFFHVVTDGTGALEFLKALTADYLRRMGAPIGSANGVLSLNEDPPPREWEDSFRRYADPTAKGSRAERSAWQITGTPLTHTAVVHGLVPVEAMKEAARAAHCSITEYLSGLLLYILWEHRTSEKPVKLSIPVNLRRFFPSHTLRNFSSYINVSLSDKPDDFEQVCQMVRGQLRGQINIDELRHRMSLNVNAERQFWLRLAPLPLKDMALKTAFALYGENLFTASLSNLGYIELPEAMKPYVERFDFVLGRPRLNALAVAVIGYGDTLNITVTRRIRESWVERALFTRLAAAGVPVSVIANREVKRDAL